ncbi:MAG: type III-B CRISPR module RAMP protein Cmr6 [Bacteroidetes bacterium]|nr:type III-B CRISPR module RAMP protein Cmr6 [Bacteroidota bacterium]
MSNWKTYKAPNLGLLFYKQVYKEEAILKEKDNQQNPSKSRLVIERDGEVEELKIFVDDKDKKKKSPFDALYADLYKQKADSFCQICNSYATQRFSLRTTYPGLLLGSGYTHDTKAKGDFKLGFFFDHTTGQPVIPGSSVKGVCRSVFETDVKDGKNFTSDQPVAAVAFILKELLEAEKNNTLFPHRETINSIIAGLTPTNIKTLISEIFGNDKIKGRDIFFDAVPDMARNGIKEFLASDFITPHQPNLLKNPKPIQFLKVKSGIDFEFRFRLTTSGEWTSEIKELFFKQVLSTIGIGAKTNVGYGQFNSL